MRETGGWSLFWKNKKTPEDIFSYDSNEKRASFRVTPPSSEPIHASFKGDPIIVKDIGAHGISFRHPDLESGDTDQVTITLPGLDKTISAHTKIICIDKDGVCHCQFQDLDEASENILHRYVLAVQLFEIKARKETRLTNGRATARPLRKP